MKEVDDFIGDKKWMKEPDRPDGQDWRTAIKLLEQLNALETQSITENPDVQRVIGQVVQLEEQNKRLKTALDQIIEMSKQAGRMPWDGLVAIIEDMATIAEQALKDKDVK